MLHKVCVFMMLAGFTGFAFGEPEMYQAITAEVFSDSEEDVRVDTVADKGEYEHVEKYTQQEPKQFNQRVVPEKEVPVWPIPGSEADFEITCDETGCPGGGTKIVTKVGSGLVVENNINTKGTGWSGGPDISNGGMIPLGFDYECANNSEMPLMQREMMEDDGGVVLAVSRSPRKSCRKVADSYSAFAEKAGFKPQKTCNATEVSTTIAMGGNSIAVNDYVDEEVQTPAQNQVRSWVVVNGQTLREVLKSWCDKEGWDLVWTSSREYPIEASAVFKGRFIDVASALVRNFERATPIPYAKFYKGNRVLVISTTEE